MVDWEGVDKPMVGIDLMSWDAENLYAYIGGRVRVFDDTYTVTYDEDTSTITFEPTDTETRRVSLRPVELLDAEILFPGIDFENTEELADLILYFILQDLDNVPDKAVSDFFVTTDYESLLWVDSGTVWYRENGQWIEDSLRKFTNSSILTPVIPSAVHVFDQHTETYSSDMKRKVII